MSTHPFCNSPLQFDQFQRKNQEVLFPNMRSKSSLSFILFAGIYRLITCWEEANPISSAMRSDVAPACTTPAGSITSAACDFSIFQFSCRHASYISTIAAAKHFLQCGMILRICSQNHQFSKALSLHLICCPPDTAAAFSPSAGQ